MVYIKLLKKQEHFQNLVVNNHHDNIRSEKVDTETY